ncbi:hypothetical protein ACQKOD_24640 [Bacillus mycoides]|uniref:hypothetical protein n=1 Tax=Bacillus mycoides TaxID=1405 RepID=UPI003CFD8D8D
MAKKFNVDTNRLLTGHNTEELTNYFIGTMANSTLVQDFAGNYGNELIIQYLIIIKYFRVAKFIYKLIFNGQVLTDSDK